MVLIPSSNSVAGAGAGSGTDLGVSFGGLGLESNRASASFRATVMIASS
jgi:hypothetical protein